MVLARYRLVLSLVAISLWALITAGPALLSRADPTLAAALLGVSSRIMLNVLVAGIALAVIALALRWNDLGFSRPRPWKSLWLLWLPGLYLLLFYGVGIAIGLPPLPTLGVLFLNTLLVGFSEELAFRGVLFRGLRTRLGMWPSVLISSALFGAIHVINVLATGDLLAAFAQAVAAAMTGVLLMALVIRTGSILPAIALHTLWDFGGFIVVTRAAQEAQAGAETPAISPLLYAVPLLFILPNFLYALFLLRRKRTGAVSVPETLGAPTVAA